MTHKSMHFPPKRQEVGKKSRKRATGHKNSVEANFVSATMKRKIAHGRARPPATPSTSPHPGGRRKPQNVILSKRQERPRENRAEGSKGGDGRKCANLAGLRENKMKA